jgi:hypothetical protein
MRSFFLLAGSWKEKTNKDAAMYLHTKLAVASHLTLNVIVLLPFHLNIASMSLQVPYGKEQAQITQRKYL